MKYSYSFACEKGSKRLDNQDSIGISNADNGILAIVCDGVGGENGGSTASSYTIKIIEDAFVNPEVQPYTSKINNALSLANKLIMQLAEEDNVLRGMATTADVLFITNGIAYWGHCGDSRIYCVYRNVLRQLTKDHSFVQSMVEKGLITAKEAEKHPQKNIITNAIGISPDLLIESGTLEFDPTEDILFLLCTDGVSGVLKDKDITEILGLRGLEEIKSEIIKRVEKKGSPDNYSFIVIANR